MRARTAVLLPDLLATLRRRGLIPLAVMLHPEDRKKDKYWEAEGVVVQHATTARVTWTIDGSAQRSLPSNWRKYKHDPIGEGDNATDPLVTAVRVAAKERGMTQQQLADAGGCSLRACADWLRGHNPNISAAVVSRMMQALDLTIS